MNTFPLVSKRNPDDVLCVGGASHAAVLVRTPGKLSSVCILKMAGNKSYTIVEYFGGDDGYRCGYCKNEKGNFSHGKCLSTSSEVP